MLRSGRRLRARLSPFLGALLLLEAVLVPALEIEDTSRAVLESEHSDATCVVGHDHSICIQVGANRAHHTSGIRFHLGVLAITSAIHGTPAAVPAHAVELAHHPRGPPAA
jgi:hypothetical protein